MKAIKNFLIQTISNLPAHDFSFTLIESIKYNNWFYNEAMYSYCLTDKVLDKVFLDYVPIGSVEFVLDFLKQYHDINGIKPLHIPKQLMKPDYLKRSCYISNKEDIKLNKAKFIKNIDKIKSYTEISDNINAAPEGNYFVSDIVEIDSEWRSFVYNNELVGLQNYLGDFTLFPCVELIKKMIADYNYSYPYTLDVGINSNGTFILECHDFFSCGLYGFADHRILPKMFITTYRKIINCLSN